MASVGLTEKQCKDQELEYEVGKWMFAANGKALAIFDRSEMEADDLVPQVGDRFVARVHNDGAV